MNHLMMAQTALGRIRGRKSDLPQIEQGLVPTPHSVAYEQRQAELRGDPVFIDLATSTLQEKLLKYFEGELGVTNATELFQSAESSRLALLKSTERIALLGFDPDNDKLSILVKGFSEAELYLLNQMVTSPDPAQAATDPEVIRLVTQKFAQGFGINLVEYLAKRLGQQRTRTKAPKIMRCVEGVHPVHLVLARLWTEPSCPLWMAPSAGAARIVGRAAGQPITPKAYNTLTKHQGLQRLPPKVLDRFYSCGSVDPAGQRLREVFRRPVSSALKKSVAAGRGRTRKRNNLAEICLDFFAGGHAIPLQELWQPPSNTTSRRRTLFRRPAQQTAAFLFAHFFPSSCVFQPLAGGVRCPA